MQSSLETSGREIRTVASGKQGPARLRGARMTAIASHPQKNPQDPTSGSPRARHSLVESATCRRPQLGRFRLRIRSGHNFGESIGIQNCQFGQNLAVQLDASGLQTMNQATVRRSVDARCCVDPSDPQSTKLPLLLTPITIRVRPSLMDRILCRSKKATSASSKTLGSF